MTRNLLHAENDRVNVALFSYVGKPRHWLENVHGHITHRLGSPISLALGERVIRIIHRTLAERVVK